METILGLMAVFALVFVNGFFVAAEFSLVGVRRTRIAQLSLEGNAGAKAAERAIQQLDAYIAATQLGITLASLGLGWIGEPAIAHLFEPLFDAFLPEEAALTVGRTISVAIAFALVTTLHIVLGELAPKSIALQRPEDVSILVSRPVSWFLAFFRPVIRLMNGIGNSVVRLLGFEGVAGHHQVHSSEELEMLVHSSREAGLLQESEERLLRRVFDFSDIYVQQIMRPRVDVDAIDISTPISELFALIAALHHSRYPVYEDDIDNVIGILHTKDLFDAVIRQPELLTRDDAVFDLRPLLREPLFVPGSATVDRLLEMMQERQRHIAVVVDEYGGMAGVATMEDVIEELVGEVQDEFDVETNPITNQGNNALVDGLVTLDEVMARFGELEVEPLSTTIGGYIAEALGRIPEVGDTIQFDSYEVSVVNMDGMRVSKVRFEHKPAAEQTDEL